MPRDGAAGALADGGVMDDALAVAEMANDLLVKHGVLLHERGGVRLNPRFADAWADAGAVPCTLHASLLWTVRKWTGGRIDGPAAEAMCVAVINLLDGTEIGRMLDAERAEWEAGQGAAAQGDVRGRMRRTRAGLEAEGL